MKTAPIRTAIALGLFAFATIATDAMAGGPASPDPATVRAALEHRSSSIKARAQPAAAATSALTQFSLRGNGAEVPNSITGTCSGAPCSASGGDCECLTYQGTLNASTVGNATWNASVTVNLDDCVNTGTEDPGGGGFCCFSDGTLQAMGSGGSASTLAMSFTGPICNDPNADDNTSLQGGFIIVTSDSTGKYAHSAGTGQLNLFEATDATTYLSGNGVFQLTSPF